MTLPVNPVVELDNGTLASLPCPPASTSGSAYSLTDTDGTLTWQSAAAASFDLILTESGEVLVDETTGNVLTEG